MANFPFTNQSRHIMVFDGDGDDIWEQGDAVWKLGYRMELASETMRHLSSGDDGQQGLAVDELRKKVGDADETLALAAQLYQPLGTALKVYGNDVRNTIKTQIDTCYQDAFEKWTAYTDLPGDENGRSYFLGIGKPDEGSAEEAEHEAEDAAKEQARDNWEDAALAYDLAYDVWEDSWDLAISTIDDAFSEDLKDSRWENFKQFLDVALEVLKWAGLVVGILALVIGGPILAAIAAAIAVLALIGTIIMAIAGDRSWGDVAWAVVDVIPVGKLGKLFQAGEKMKFVKELGKNFDPQTYKKGWDALKKSNIEGWGDGASKGIVDGATALLTGKNSSGWKKLWNDNMDISNWRAAANPGFLDRAGERIIRFGGTAYESAFTVTNNVFKVQDWGTTISNGITGGDDTSWRKSNPVLRVIF